jgi:hypothetical protein
MRWHEARMEMHTPLLPCRAAELVLDNEMAIRSGEVEQLALCSIWKHMKFLGGLKMHCIRHEGLTFGHPELASLAGAAPSAMEFTKGIFRAAFASAQPMSAAAGRIISGLSTRCASLASLVRVDGQLALAGVSLDNQSALPIEDVEIRTMFDSIDHNGEVLLSL